jgi:predicted lipoprotein
MLINWADNIILPSLTDLEFSLNQLNEKATLFVNTPSNDNLLVLRESWLNSFLKWQHVEMFDLGYAEEIYYKNRLNLYPTNIERIEDNISSLDYDLNQSYNFSSQGFNGLDYMLFGIGQDDDEIVSKYLAEDLNYDKYLIDLIDKMVELTLAVKNSWNDEFRESFINSIDNTSTSSINTIINDFVYYFEKGFRANKIGIPAGVFSNNVLPDRVEAYHGKIYSKLLVTEASYAIDNFFNGRYYNDNDSSGLSINAYLNFIENDQDEKLAEKINEQLDKIFAQLDQLDNDLSMQVVENNLSMLSTYDVIQANVVLLKVDMLQKLNINVDYADADGD